MHIFFIWLLVVIFVTLTYGVQTLQFLVFFLIFALDFKTAHYSTKNIFCDKVTFCCLRQNKPSNIWCRTIPLPLLLSYSNVRTWMICHAFVSHSFIAPAASCMAQDCHCKPRCVERYGWWLWHDIMFVTFIWEQN